MEDMTWNEQYKEEKREWKNLVIGFIDIANGKRDAYKEIENYEFLRYFNFDILNLNYSINKNYLNILSLKANVSISNLKNILTYRKTYIGDNSDPDNMQIVRAILLLIFDKEKLKKIYDSFHNLCDEKIQKIEELLSNNINNKGLKGKQYLIKETISLYKKINNPCMLRPDTTNSYNSIAVNKYDFVFSTEYLDLFNKIELDEIQKLERDFYYDYHTLPNFCILPNETLEEHIQRYICWMKNRINGTNKKMKISDSINKYRGRIPFLNKSEFGKDNFYSYLFLLENIWDSLVKENEGDMVKKMGDKGIQNANTISQLFLNNSYFYKVFNSFNEYCDEMMIDYSLYVNREKNAESIRDKNIRDMKVKKSFYDYNKLIFEYRWNQIKDRLFRVLNEDESLLI